jgi:hypothetical protein
LCLPPPAGSAATIGVAQRNCFRYSMVRGQRFRRPPHRRFSLGQDGAGQPAPSSVSIREFKRLGSRVAAPIPTPNGATSSSAPPGRRAMPTMWTQSRYPNTAALRPRLLPFAEATRARGAVSAPAGAGAGLGADLSIVVGMPRLSAPAGGKVTLVDGQEHPGTELRLS